MTGLTGTAMIASSRLAYSQQPEQMRRVGVLMGYGDSDPEGRRLLSTFLQRLAELSWNDGANMRLEVRWGAGSAERMQTLAKELVALQPDVIFSHTTAATAALHRATLAIPIVFVNVSDPVGPGFVENLPHPGGNITGFIYAEASMSGKWVELLNEIAPGIKRVAIIFNPDTAPGGGNYFLGSFEAACRTLGVVTATLRVRSDAEIETGINSLGGDPRTGLVVMPDSFMEVHRGPIISLTARNNVPAIYYDLRFVRDGGLIAYGPDIPDFYRRAAQYVDRILRGEKPADLPVQLAVKFDMAVNAKTAYALGLTVPPYIIMRTDEVIE
jgi:putative ABC transport system substrate-binding protein